MYSFYKNLNDYHIKGIWFFNIGNYILCRIQQCLYIIFNHEIKHVDGMNKHTRSRQVRKNLRNAITHVHREQMRIF